jgi:sugar lactone lactonase YvrE
MSLNGSNPTTALDFGGLAAPYYLYVDENDNIYLSNTVNHSVLLFLSNSTNSAMVAGTGVVGNNNDQLNRPYGVFVNHNGTMYIADFQNHRIMKWFSGASFGIVVAGNGTAGFGSTQLQSPTQVVVDTNEYMYISEAGNSRITRWAPNSIFGVCIAACSGTAGPASTQLNGPHSLAFDSNGSLYVSDRANNRVQKFQILPCAGAYVINLLITTIKSIIFDQI